MENMNDFVKKPEMEETEENLNVDSQGNTRSLRTMRDGSIQHLSDSEFMSENQAIGENIGDRTQN